MYVCGVHAVCVLCVVHVCVRKCVWCARVCICVLGVCARREGARRVCVGVCARRVCVEGVCV